MQNKANKTKNEIEHNGMSLNLLSKINVPAECSLQIGNRHLLSVPRGICNASRNNQQLGI